MGPFATAAPGQPGNVLWAIGDRWTSGFAGHQSVDAAHAATRTGTLMCGIAGFWMQGASRAPAEATAIVHRMADRIRHRGPDDHGMWCDADADYFVAHRRLSILDTSAAGHQPMISASGRWVITYNGEIYNHLDLRQRLERSGAAPAWRGHSDTETLLAAAEAWGVEKTLEHSVGMFAFALWDRAQRTLWLARDRIGEKPLYYGRQGDVFLFASELTALRAHPQFRGEIDRNALTLLLRHNYVPDPYSIYQGIRKVPPGAFLRVTQRDVDPRPTVYWSLAEIAERGAARPFEGSSAEALAGFERCLGTVVRRQMLSDVPLGSLLSGGIDSSLVTALMQANSDRPVRTFTIGVADGDFDESVHARAVASHLGTDHTEWRLSGADALTIVPKIGALYDEPFADPSQIPTQLLMSRARSHVTVALSGDGGDELFGGYNRYRMGPKVWARTGWMPARLRHGFGKVLTAIPVDSINRLTRHRARRAGILFLGEKVHKLGWRLSRTDSVDDLYVALVSEWLEPQKVVVGGRVPENRIDTRDRWPALPDPSARMMALDCLTYLPGNILTKADRASMAVSLETRAPLVDREVIEFAWSLPTSMKLRDDRGKWLLRELLYRYVPRELVDRPKVGFGIPLDAWLRGPLWEWAEALIAQDRLDREGFFDSALVRRTWQAHLSGRFSFGSKLWSVLMFQAWRDAIG